ncbi:MAG: hypothetical protein ACI4SS_04570, partial [Clostridia bacterium]
MEINRGVLKKRAWDALKGIYWFMFLACILAGLVGAASTSSGLSFNMNFNLNSNSASSVENNVVEEFRRGSFNYGGTADNI